jgi:MFS transporter, DHA1 family, inner membrane transport protein
VAARGRSVGALAAIVGAAFSMVTVEQLPVGLLGLMARDLHETRSTIGLLVSSYGLVVALVSVPLTHLVRRVPRRLLLSGLLAVFVVSTAVSATVSGFWTLMGARVVTAVSQAVFWSVAAVTASGLFSPQARSRVLSMVLGGGALAPVLGVPAATWIGQHSSWRTSFLAVSALGVLALVATALLLPTSAPQEGHAARGSAPDARRYALILVVTALGITGAFTSYTYITVVLTDVAGFPSSALSLLLLCLGAAGVAGTLVVGAVAGRAPRAALAAAVALLAASLLALEAFGTSPAPAVALAGVAAFASAALPPAMVNQVLTVAPGSADVASAGHGSAFNLGIAGGALVGGWVLAGAGARPVPLVGGLLVVAALLVVLGEPWLTGARSRGAGSLADSSAGC